MPTGEAGHAKVQADRVGSVGVLAIDRPEVRNAIDDATAAAIEQALDAFEQAPGCAVVVLTGTGDKAFSAGLDLKAFRVGAADHVATARGGFAGIVRRDFPKPLIAAVNGAALAGGLEIMLACDLAVAAEHAVFGLPEVKRGLIAAGGGLLRLPHRLPRAVALDLLLAGGTIDAARAHELGLISGVARGRTVLDAALELAETIATNSPAAVRASLRLAREVGESVTPGDWETSDALSREAHACGDAIEGATAFAERREPVWRSAW